MNATMLEAAAARAAQVRQLADRPSQRRSGEYSRSGSRVSFRAALELREQPDSGLLRFHGVASVTEKPYEMWDMFGPYTEVVSAGAFTQTLARVDLDTTLNLGHDQMRRIARTTLGSLLLAETEEGLDVDADLDPADPDVAYAAPKLRSGLYDEMSFAFRIEAGMWSPDYTEFRINAVDIHRGDTAIVGYGANPFTHGGLVTKSAAPSRSTGLTRAALEALYLR